MGYQKRKNPWEDRQVVEPFPKKFGKEARTQEAPISRPRLTAGKRETGNPQVACTSTKGEYPDRWVREVREEEDDANYPTWPRDNDM